MRRSQTVAAGWVQVKQVLGDPDADFHVTMIPWREGLTEYAVFGVTGSSGRVGEAVPVGTARSYR